MRRISNTVPLGATLIQHVRHNFVYIAVINIYITRSEMIIIFKFGTSCLDARFNERRDFAFFMITVRRRFRETDPSAELVI